MLVRLSRRNLETLLSKLNRTRDGTTPSNCELLKCINKNEPGRPQYVNVKAVENEEEYINHRPGPISPEDESNLNSIGDEF